MELLKTLGIDAFKIILTAMCGYIVRLLQNQEKQRKINDEKLAKEKAEEEIKRKAERHGSMLMLRYMLKRYHTEYMWQGYITDEQLKDYEELHEAYTSLGGNSVEGRWYRDVLTLPIKESESDLSPYARAYLKTLKQEQK